MVERQCFEAQKEYFWRYSNCLFYHYTSHELLEFTGFKPHGNPVLLFGKVLVPIKIRCKLAKYGLQLLQGRDALDF